MNRSQIIRSAWVICFGFTLLAPGIASAGRFISVPAAEVIPSGRYNLWHFALYEERSARTWRQLNRLDLGLAKGVEVGILNIRPKDQPSDTWINVQYQPFQDQGWRPALSIGVWDIFRRASFFSDAKAGPSPFAALGKGFKAGPCTFKGTVGYGFSRLHGGFGGAEARLREGTGLLLEYAPPNLRLSRTEAWDVGVYQWFGKHVRARVSWMGGNPMMDIFWTAQVGGS